MHPTQGYLLVVLTFCSNENCILYFAALKAVSTLFPKMDFIFVLVEKPMYKLVGVPLRCKNPLAAVEKLMRKFQLGFIRVLSQESVMTL